jgi:hypothetical protein
LEGFWLIPVNDQFHEGFVTVGYRIPSDGNCNNAKLCHDHSDYHQHYGTYAFDPGCSAEEQPPHNDSQRSHEAAHHAEDERLRSNHGHYEPEQPKQRDGDDAGPQARGFWRIGFATLFASFGFSSIGVMGMRGCTLPTERLFSYFRRD